MRKLTLLFVFCTILSNSFAGSIFTNPTLSSPTVTGTADFSGATVTGLTPASVKAAIVSVVAKSAAWTVTSADEGKLFDVTTGSSNVQVTLPSASSVRNGFGFFLRKADNGTGLVTTTPAVSPAATSVAVQGHSAWVYSDGTNWYARHWHGGFDASGKYTISSGANQNIAINPGSGTMTVAGNISPTSVSATGTVSGATIVGDGSSLTGLAASQVGFTQTGTGAVATNLDARNKAMPLNAKTDFGATGNGSTDDTTALQAAITSGIAQKRPVYIPTGTYKLTGELLISGSAQGLFIFGDGSRNTKLVQFTSGAHGMHVHTSSGCEGLHVENLGLYYGGASASSGTGLIIDTSPDSLDEGCFRNIDIDTYAYPNPGWSVGFDLTDVANSTFDNVPVSNCSTAQGRISGNSNSNVFNNCSVSASATGVWADGVIINNGRAPYTHLGGDFGGPGLKSGVVVNGGTFIKIEGANAEMYTGAQLLKMTSASTSATIDNTYSIRFVSPPSISVSTFNSGTNTVTLTLANSHGFVVGTKLTVSGTVGGTNDGTFTITAASGNTVSYVKAGGVAHGSETGTASPTDYDVEQVPSSSVAIINSAVKVRQDNIIGVTTTAVGCTPIIDVYSNTGTFTTTYLGSPFYSLAGPDGEPASASTVGKFKFRYNFGNGADDLYLGIQTGSSSYAYIDLTQYYQDKTAGLIASTGANTWTATQTIADGVNLAISKGTHGSPGNNMSGMIVFPGVVGATRNAAIANYIFNSGDFALLMSAANTAVDGDWASGSNTNPKSPFWYYDGVNNRTTIGHLAATAPSGSATLNVEGSINVGSSGGTNITKIRHGTVQLSGGTATVSDSNITTNTRIFLTAQSLGTVSAPKALAVTSRSAGTSFTITSADNTDTSTIAWEEIEP